MERYKPTSHHDSLVHPPLAVAIWYGEQVTSDLPVRHETAIQKYPAHVTDNFQNPKYDDVSAKFCANIRAPYDAYEEHLKRIYKQLRHPINAECHSSDELHENSDIPEVSTYLTTLGILCFAELYERTRKYAAFVLHHTYQVHPTDINDGLQAGYTQLWKHLAQEPDLLKGKQMAWIGKGIVYNALHAIRHDWMYQKHTQPEEGRSSTDKRGTHSPESRQTDIRIDLHQAIATVAAHILTNEKGKKADHQIWALYGLTMLHVGSSEASRLFHVREQSMQVAYNDIREQLKAALPYYAPSGATKRVGQHGPDALPKQDMTAIRQANENVSDTTYEAVRTKISTINADTRKQDEIALEGIRKGISISVHARTYGIPQYQMQRAYKRVHLMIAAEYDPTVRCLRAERRMKYVFTLTAESAIAVNQLALELLEQPKNYEKLVALHAHIGNLAISTTAKYFNIPTSTLRYYSQQIGKRLKTPSRPARDAGQDKSDTQLQRKMIVYSSESTTDYASG